MKEMYDKVERWCNASDEVERLRAALRTADCELSNACNDLGKFMLPKDVSKLDDNETFNVWVRTSNSSTASEGLLTVRYTDNNNFELEWRQKPQ